MTNEAILIPQRRIVEARPFYTDRTDKALKELEKAKNLSCEIPHPKGLPAGKSTAVEWGIKERKSTLG